MPDVVQESGRMNAITAVFLDEGQCQNRGSKCVPLESIILTDLSLVLNIFLSCVSSSSSARQTQLKFMPFMIFKKSPSPGSNLSQQLSDTPPTP